MSELVILVNETGAPRCERQAKPIDLVPTQKPRGIARSPLGPPERESQQRLPYNANKVLRKPAGSCGHREEASLYL